MKSFRDLVRKVIQFPQRLGKPHASDLEIPRVLAWASGSQSLLSPTWEEWGACRLEGEAGDGMESV